MQAHNDHTSLTYSFYEVITAGNGAPVGVRDLKKRCLDPGKYAKHLDRWLKYFSPHQVSNTKAEGEKRRGGSNTFYPKREEISGFLQMWRGLIS